MSTIGTQTISLETPVVRRFERTGVTPVLSKLITTAMMIIWRIRGMIIRTVLCCVVRGSCAHAYEQFFKLTVGYGRPM